MKDMREDIVFAALWLAVRWVELKRLVKRSLSLCVAP